jgi:UTP--glucose-1-phosphate uridylyltransferase
VTGSLRSASGVRSLLSSEFGAYVLFLSAALQMSSSSNAAPVRVDPGQFVSDALSKAGVLDSDTASEFGRLFSRFIKQTKKNALDWSKLSPPGKDLVLEHSSLEPCPDDSGLHNELLNKVAIVKLNGGLGTSMGCKGPKSAIPVRAGSTFLDLTVRQVEYLNTRFGVDVPLILMNSFRTHEATVKILNKYAGHHVSITCFTQSCFPRIDRDHFTPLPLGPFSPENEDQWCVSSSRRG